MGLPRPIHESVKTLKQASVGNSPIMLRLVPSIFLDSFKIEYTDFPFLNVLLLCLFLIFALAHYSLSINNPSLTAESPDIGILFKNPYHLFKQRREKCSYTAERPSGCQSAMLINTVSSTFTHCIYCCFFFSSTNTCPSLKSRSRGRRSYNSVHSLWSVMLPTMFSLFLVGESNHIIR